MPVVQGETDSLTYDNECEGRPQRGPGIIHVTVYELRNYVIATGLDNKQDSIRKATLSTVLPNL